jgi:hypothetical protein
LKWKCKKWPTLHFLSSSIWMWLFVKFLIYHIFMVIAIKKAICNMIIIKLFTWLAILFQSSRIITFNKYYNFIKIKNHFNHFLNIFIFFSKMWHVYFLHKYILTSHHVNYLFIYCIWLLWGLTYHNMQKNMKILHNNDMVEVQTWDPWKLIQCDNNLGSPIVCFHPFSIPSFFWVHNFQQTIFLLL